MKLTAWARVLLKRIPSAGLVKKSVWSLACQQSVFQRYHSGRRFSRILLTMAAKASLHQNYVTVTLCVMSNISVVQRMCYCAWLTCNRVSREADRWALILHWLQNWSTARRPNCIKASRELPRCSMTNRFHNIVSFTIAWMVCTDSPDCLLLFLSISVFYF